jgi:hypothetical protein
MKFSRLHKGAGAILLSACLFVLPQTAEARNLHEPGKISRWAYVEETMPVHAEPNMQSRVIRRLAPRTNKGTTELVQLLEEKTDENDQVWVKVSLPIRPLGTTGWVQDKYLSEYHVVTTHVVINRKMQTLTLHKDGKIIFRKRVGVGKSSTPTPSGQFYVRMKLTGQSGIYGPLAFGTSALSNVLTDWPGGGFIGIHGTNQPWLLPGRVSNGCVRMKNRDIIALSRLMPVGTPITII